MSDKAQLETCRGDGAELCKGCSRFDEKANKMPFSWQILLPDEVFCQGYIGDYEPNPTTDHLE